MDVTGKVKKFPLPEKMLISIKQQNVHDITVFTFPRYPTVLSFCFSALQYIYRALNREKISSGPDQLTQWGSYQLKYNSTHSMCPGVLKTRIKKHYRKYKNLYYITIAIIKRGIKI